MLLHYRGRSIYDNSLVFGFCFESQVGIFVGPYNEEQQIHPDSLSIYSGINDKKGVKIFSGDTIQDLISGNIYKVKYGYCHDLNFTGWYVESQDGKQLMLNADHGENVNSGVLVKENQ